MNKLKYYLVFGVVALLFGLSTYTSEITAADQVESNPWKLLGQMKDADRKPDMIFDILVKGCPHCVRMSVEIYEVGVVVRHGSDQRDAQSICTMKSDVEQMRKEIRGSLNSGTLKKSCENWLTAPISSRLVRMSVREGEGYRICSVSSASLPRVLDSLAYAKCSDAQK